MIASLQLGCILEVSYHSSIGLAMFDCYSRERGQQLLSIIQRYYWSRAIRVYIFCVCVYCSTHPP